MEIKVGEYVRLARGQGINKIIDIKEYGDLILDNDITDKDGDQCCLISSQDADKEILNHSFNILELIEVNDFVNGHRVANIKNDEGRIEIGLETDHMINYYIEKEDIKTILTHEQYERISYRLGDN